MKIVVGARDQAGRAHKFSFPIAEGWTPEAAHDQVVSNLRAYAGISARVVLTCIPGGKQ